ncbi:MAG TPA: hypothetical protein VKB80_23770 [Kofleriaceae bacterium]|nr:hypothetical protein [Kofleriaceae bacterium]
MPERPDLRHIAASLRESLDGLDSDALVDVLTYVLNEYVVEGPPPLAAHQVERLEDLAGLSLAALVVALQTRLDVAGLELLRVEGEEVRVHTAGGWVPLQPLRDSRTAGGQAASAPDPGRPGADAAAPRPAAPAIRPAASAPAAPTGRAAADEALSRGRGDLLGGERGVVTPPAPRPRGLSISGRPSASPSSAPPPSSAQPARPATGPANPASPPGAANPPGPPGPAPATNDESGGDRKHDGKQDDASIRFSLLELD